MPILRLASSLRPRGPEGLRLGPPAHTWLPDEGELESLPSEEDELRSVLRGLCFGCALSMLFWIPFTLLFSTITLRM